MYKQIENVPWSISCPKCGRTQNQDTITCHNCGGHPYGTLTQSDSDYKIVSALLHCNKCKTIMSYINCECGCNLLPMIRESLVKTPVKACFIATVAYDSPHHPDVQTLRDFRDSMLARHGWGVRFINWYYLHGKALSLALRGKKTLLFWVKTSLGVFSKLLRLKR